MLEKYKNLIYKDKTEEAKTFELCVSNTLALHPECSEAELMKALSDNKSNILSHDFCREMLMTEGKLLFDITVKRFGKELWKAEKTDTMCKKLCPFGDMCKQELINIDGEDLCYGQILYRNIDIQEFLRKNNNDEILADFFFRYEWYIMYFGDYCELGKRVNGENVISRLGKDWACK